MSRPTISIAMATYNGARYLAEQLDSFLAQTCPPLELVVGDDGSSDETLAILDAFAAAAPFPVRIIRNARNLGFADNFLATASRCAGTWIALCDQDDRWRPDKLERIAAAIGAEANDDLVLVAHRLRLCDSALVPTGAEANFYRWRGTRRLARGTAPGLWSLGGCQMVVRRDLVQALPWDERPFNENGWINLGRPKDRRIAHDRWMSMLANAVGDTLLIAPELTDFRRHAETTTGSHQAQGLAGRLSGLRGADGAHYARERDAALAAGRCLDTLSSAAPPAWQQRLKDGAARFEQLAATLDTRARIHGGGAAGARLLRFLGALTGGQYLGPRFSAAGWRAMLKDAVRLLAR